MVGSGSWSYVVNHLAILIHCTPEVMLLAVDLHEDFIDVESVAIASLHYQLLLLEIIDESLEFSISAPKLIATSLRIFP